MFQCPVHVLKSSPVYMQIRRHWGGGQMGNKSVARVVKLERTKERERAQKMAA